MDASKITELRAKQANRYINRAKTVDSSTLTWQNQIMSSRFIASTVPLSVDPNSPYSQVVNCTTCSAESLIAIQSNSVGQTAPLYPNPRLGTGSASVVYSCDKILLQRAGNAQCCNSPLNLPVVPGLATTQNAPEPYTMNQTVQASQYVILPACDCTDTNAGAPDPNNPNAMLPPASGYNLYLPFPTSLPPVCQPCVEQNTPPEGYGYTQENAANGKAVILNNRFVPTDPCCCVINPPANEQPIDPTTQNASLVASQVSQTNSVRATHPTRLP
jgi:hypothetical protein